MGQPKVGINRQGMDLSAREMHALNAETCAEYCRTNDLWQGNDLRHLR